MRTTFIGGSVVMALAAVVALGLPKFSDLTTAQSFRAIFGTIYILLLPGFVWSFVAGDRLHARTDWIARLIVAIGLSSALVPLMLFLGTRIGLSITVRNIVIEVGLLIVLGLLVNLIIGRSARRQS